MPDPRGVREWAAQAADSEARSAAAKTRAGHMQSACSTTSKWAQNGAASRVRPTIRAKHTRPGSRSAGRKGVPDEILMALYAAGDASAFDELFRRYEPRAYAFFVRRTRSPERARDLYQDLFLRLHRARDHYDESRAFAPWFFQIAHRLLVDDARRTFRSREVPIEDGDLPSERPGAEDQLATRQCAARVLDALSAEERYVLMSSKIEGIGYPELAARLGKSLDAVKKVASRAIQRLRATAPAAGASGLGWTP